MIHLLILLSGLKVEVKPDTALIGDSLRINIAGELPESVYLLPPDSFPDVMVLDSLKRTGDSTGFLTITSFSTGKQEVKIRAGSDTIITSYFIRSLLSGKDKGPSPIEPPIGFINWHYFLWILLLPVAYLIYRYVKKRRGREVFVEEEEMEPCEEARENLRRLEEKIEKWEWNKIYTNLSYITRRYIEREFGIPAVEATTSELNTLIKKSDNCGSELVEIARSMYEWDLIKFADESSSREKVLDDIEGVRRLIDKKEKEEKENDSA